jgi:hypothetical protein
VSDALPHTFGDPEFKARLDALCTEYSDIFSTKLSPQPADIPPMEIEVDESKWLLAKHRTLPRYTTSQSLTRPTTKAQAWRHVLLAPKLDAQWRFCVDYRCVNDATTATSWQIPNVATSWRIGSAKPIFFGKMDLTQGYFQAPLSENSRIYTSFILFMCIFEYLRVPMGPKGAPPYFQSTMATVVLVGLIYIYNL